jgi:mRNA interferase MazF
MDRSRELGTAVNRGDVWMVDLGGRVGRRPVVVLTRDAVIGHLNKVTVAEITSQGKGYPTEIALGTRANLSRDSFVQADNIHTIPKRLMSKFVGTIDESTMGKISMAVVLALGLEQAIDMSQ